MADEKKDELKEGKKEERGEGKTAADEYNSGWDEADKLLGGEGSEEYSENTEEGGSGEGLSDNVQTPDKTGEPKEKKPAASDEEPHEKALKDTKAWATKLAQENAELKRTVEAFKKGNASADDVKDAHQAAAKAQADFDSARVKVYADYPELKDLIDPLVESSKKLSDEVKALRADKEADEEKKKHDAVYEHFNAHVRPEVVKVHPDFDSIMTKEVDGKKAANDEYFEWAAKQRPALKFAAMESSDPQDINWALTEFKKFKASPDAEAFRQRQEKKIKDKITNTQTLRGGSTPFPAGSVKKGDPEDYDAGWNEADAILKKQGVG